MFKELEIFTVAILSVKKFANFFYLIELTRMALSSASWPYLQPFSGIFQRGNGRDGHGGSLCWAGRPGLWPGGGLRTRADTLPLTIIQRGLQLGWCQAGVPVCTVHIHLFKQRSVSLRDTVDSLIKTRVQTTIFVFRFAFQAKFKFYYFFRNCFC